jgi:hypothetical protein
MIARSAVGRSRRILKALKQNLLTPKLVAEFTCAYQEEVNRLMKDASGKAAEIEAKLAGVLRKIDGIMRAIEDGLYQPSRSEANPRDLHCGHRTSKNPRRLCHSRVFRIVGCGDRI